MCFDGDKWSGGVLGIIVVMVVSELEVPLQFVKKSKDVSSQFKFIDFFRCWDKLESFL